MNIIFLKRKRIIKQRNRSVKKITCIVTILLPFFSLTDAQNEKTTIKTNQIWVDFNAKNQVSDRLYLSGKIGLKTISPKTWNKAYTNIEVSYNLPKFIFKEIQRKETIYGGMDLYYIDFIDKGNAVEISPYQGYSIYWPNTNKLSLKHNVELTERFQWINEINEYSFGLKTSYELEFTYKFYKELINKNEGFFAGISSKFWWNLISANIFNDVFRITPKVGYQFNSNWKIAFYTGYNYTRSLSTEKFHSDNIIYRLRIYYNF